MAAFEELIAGQLFNSVLSPITTFVGAGVLWAILWFGVLGIVFMKSKNFGLTMLVAMVTSFAVVPQILPGLEKYIIIFIIAGFGFMMFDVFKSKR
jgi:hypothetical protein